MKDHSAGGITNAEAKTLLDLLRENLNLPGFEIHQGVSYRNLLVYRGGQEFDVTTKPPHEFPEEPTSKYVPKGKGADVLNQIIDLSKRLYADHEINQVRKDNKLNPASQVWLWGQGHAPAMPKFVDRFGVKSGCMITGVDLLRGLANLLGWECHEVEGMTSFHDTNYKQQGIDTAAMLDKYDLVLSHVESPDEASHQADWKTKIDAIEHIDKYVVGPVIEKLKTYPEWRLLVLPDHPTNIATRKHGYAPTCFAMAGTGVHTLRPSTYNERNAAASGLNIAHGHELMEYFLKGGGR
jgi:2,3-bisphosphoglycerate-independent phosphoglycerate mutase